MELGPNGGTARLCRKLANLAFHGTLFSPVVALRLRVERVTQPPDLRPGLLPVIASRLISRISEACAA
jgi:hypothetical protein